MDSESGFTYCFHITVAELENDEEIPEDFEVENEDKGRYRICHALVDCNCKTPPDPIPIMETFDERLFKQSSYVPSGQAPSCCAQSDCRDTILHHLGALLTKQRENKGSKFLLRVEFGAYLDKADEEYEEEEAEEETEEEGKPVPASKSAIEGLEKVSGLGRGAACVICLGGNWDKEKSLALKMPCAQIYHQDCIVEWLQKSHLCPLCRYALPVDG